MTKKKFSNLEELRKERMKLQIQCKEKEEELTEHLQYVQDNIGTLVLTSLLPFGRSKNDAIGGILSKVTGFFGRITGLQEKIPEKAQPFVKIAEMLLAGLAYRYVRKLFRR
jgi:hypothetical protein